MDEVIDILTPEGKPTGKTALKSEAHKKGWYHATVHIWLFTTSKKILLQKRALTKKIFPGLWDISVAGHIGAGESVLNAAKREVFEEIGLELSEEDLIKMRKDELSPEGENFEVKVVDTIYDILENALVENDIEFSKIF